LQVFLAIFLFINHINSYFFVLHIHLKKKEMTLLNTEYSKTGIKKKNSRKNRKRFYFFTVILTFLSVGL
jgi:hypothetical protein